MICPNCHREIKDDAKFCKYCGNSTETVREQPTKMESEGDGNKTIKMDRKKIVMLSIVVLAIFLVIALLVAMSANSYKRPIKELEKALNNNSTENLDELFPMEYLNEDTKMNLENSIKNFSGVIDIEFLGVYQIKQESDIDFVIDNMQLCWEGEMPEISKLYHATVRSQHDPGNSLCILEIDGKYYLDPYYTLGRILHWQEKCLEQEEHAESSHSNTESSDSHVVSGDVSASGFVSDWGVGERNTVGNSTWNLNSFSYVTEQGDWIYYIMDKALHKENKNGEKHTIASPVEGRNLNIIGDYLYYYSGNAIHRIKTDGSEASSMPATDEFFVTEDGIVYTSSTQVSAGSYQYEIKTCDLNFGDVKTIHKFEKKTDSSMHFDFLGVYNEKVYMTAYYKWNKGYGYTSSDDFTAVGICAIDIKNASFEIVSNNVQFTYITGFIVGNEIIGKGARDYSGYYCEDPLLESKVYSFNLDTFETKTLVDFPCRIASLGYLSANNQLVVGSEIGIWRGSAGDLNSGYGFEISSDWPSYIALTDKYLYYETIDDAPTYNDTDIVYRVDYNGENWEKLGRLDVFSN